MRLTVIATACLALLCVAAAAQDKKKSKKDNAETNPPAQSWGGYPACDGGFFIVEDGHSSVRCRRRDGKVCTIEAGTSGQGVLTNCL